MIKALVKKRHLVHAVAPKIDTKDRRVLNELGVTTHDCYFERTGTNIISDLKASIHLYYSVFQLLFIKYIQAFTIVPLFSLIGS